MASYTKETTRFLSADGKTQVAAFFYSPTVDAPKAVIQISDKFPNVGAMKTSSVSATVQPKEN